FLELCNAPCYFSDFVRKAGEHDLAYLAEAEISAMFASNYGARAADALLREYGDQESLEQALDFLTNRTFRQTLLVHAERAPQGRDRITSERLEPLHIAAFFTPAAATGDDASGRWRSSQGRQELNLQGPVAMQLVDALNAAWPGTVPVAALADAAD